MRSRLPTLAVFAAALGVAAAALALEPQELLGEMIESCGDHYSREEITAVLATEEAERLPFAQKLAIVRNATSCGDHEALRLLFEAWRPLAPRFLAAKTRFGETLLHLAIVNGNTETIRLLIQQGAGPNAANADGETALHYLADHDRWSDEEGGAELDLSAIRSPKVGARDRNGATPLHSAALFGDVDLAKFLLARRADPNARDKQGRTPLHGAAIDGDPEAIALLLNAGAKADAVGKDGKTPLDLALANERLVASRLLRKALGVAEPVLAIDARTRNSAEIGVYWSGGPEPVRSTLGAACAELSSCARSDLKDPNSK